jgi:hypothetical protein
MKSPKEFLPRVSAINFSTFLLFHDALCSEPTETGTNHTLGPLALPALPTPAPSSALLSRLDSLSYTLCYLLRTPTTERAGSVPVPIGALAELGVRLISLNEETSVKERVDPAVVRTVYASLGRLQVAGGRILATVAAW